MTIPIHLRFRQNGSHTHSLMVTRDLVQVTNHLKVAQVSMVMMIQKYNNYEVQNNVLILHIFMLYYMKL